MQFSPKDINDAVNAMVGAMNERSEKDVDVTKDRRAEPRRASCAKCDLWVFDKLAKRKKIPNVITRNSSFCGISVVAKLSEPPRVGRPVEAVVAVPDGSHKHAAGIVAFCRSMDDGYYELGIEVKAVGSHEILTDEVNELVTRYTWFAEALQALEEETGEQTTG